MQNHLLVAGKLVLHKRLLRLVSGAGQHVRRSLYLFTPLFLCSQEWDHRLNYFQECLGVLRLFDPLTQCPLLFGKHGLWIKEHKHNV